MRDFELAKTLLSTLDLTSLGKNDNETNITTLCDNAKTEYGNVAAVCVYSKFIPMVQKLLEGTKVKIATVVNFPKGSVDAESVVAEIKKAIGYGADEIDAVFPYNSFLNGNIEDCRKMLSAIVDNASSRKIKIILESGAFKGVRSLQDACRLCLEYKIDFLKTSTGKIDVSATVDAANAILEVIHETPRNVGFKASGGIKTFEQARQYYILAQSVMGEKWPTAKHFRIGASSLLKDLLNVIKQGY